MLEKRFKIYYDAEFTGLHQNTTPISVGFVSESGATFYAEFNDYDKDQVTPWIKENVINRLIYAGFDEHYERKDIYDSDHTDNPCCNICMKGSKANVSVELLGWLLNESHNSGGTKLQIYCDCYAYDWIVFNNLVCPDGDALQIPNYIDYIPMDLSTVLQTRGVDPDISREEYVGNDVINNLIHISPFSLWGCDMKHNCLWDAFICRECFNTSSITEDEEIDFKDILEEEI